MSPNERIEQAFLQLQFSIKTMNYFEQRKVDKDVFDSRLIIDLPNGPLAFKRDAFHSYDDLVLAAQNGYSLTLGATAITLDDALRKAGIHNDPDDRSPTACLRSLVYMIRCAFAHDMMTPRWCISAHYRQVLEVKLASRLLKVDLLALDGKPLEDTHFGGVNAWYEIKDAAIALVCQTDSESPAR